MIIPNSDIYLLQTPFEISNLNQLTFSNKDSQFSYFSSLPHLLLEDATYQRKERVIRYPSLLDDILTYNYCMYRNTNYSDKWFYAYITEMRYVNDNMTEITIELDVFQTWQFDVVYKPSFVEREHVNNDTRGLHTIPEDIETGDMICNEHVIDDRMDDITSDMCFILASSVDIYGTKNAEGGYPMSGGVLYNGVYSGVKYFRYDNESTLSGDLEKLANAGQLDAVVGVFVAPKELAVRKTTETQTLFEIQNTTSPVSYTNQISKMNRLNGYTPHNNKTLCYPYNYLLVSNNNGSSYIYRYEEFSDTLCRFQIDMAITAGCSIRMVPLNYKNIARNDEYGINMGKLPICSYPCDMYTNWLTQNSVNILGTNVSSDELNLATSVGSGLINAISGVATGNVGAVLSPITSITDSILTKRQHELIPAQARGNVNCGDVIFSSNKNTFHFYKMSIKEEYASVIDNYFSMYGYKVNTLKVPNITGRANWNYVKTIQCNLIGNFPQDDLNTLKQMFDRGVTLWHNPTTFLDYSVPNGIV